MQVHRYEDQYFPGIGDEDTIRPAPIKADFARPKHTAKHASHVHHTASKHHHSKKTQKA
jgi:hypothetical protein